MAGATKSFGAGDSDILILKLNSGGNIVWQKTHGQLEYDGPASVIQQTFDSGGVPDGYVIAGATEIQIGTFLTLRGLILRLNVDGTINWDKTYGETWYDRTRAVQQTADKRFVVAGYKSVSGGKTANWVIRLNPRGEIPGCGIIATNSLISQDATAVIEDTNIADQASSAVPMDTAVTPQNASPSVAEVCTDAVLHCFACNHRRSIRGG